MVKNTIQLINKYIRCRPNDGSNSAKPACSTLAPVNTQRKYRTGHHTQAGQIKEPIEQCSESYMQGVGVGEQSAASVAAH